MKNNYRVEVEYEALDGYVYKRYYKLNSSSEEAACKSAHLKATKLKDHKKTIKMIAVVFRVD